MTETAPGRPTAAKWLSNAWTKIRVKPFSYVLIVLIFVALSMLVGIPQAGAQFIGTIFKELYWVGLIFGYAVNILLSPAVGAGAVFAFIQAARGRDMRAENLFEGFRNFWRVVGAFLLLILIIYAGIFLLIVPGFIFAFGFKMAVNLVVERRMKVMDALRLSWRITRGYKGQLFLMLLMIAGIGLVLLLPEFAVGVLIALIGLDNFYCFIIPVFLLMVAYAIPVYFFMVSLLFLADAEAYVDLLDRYERSQGLAGTGLPENGVAVPLAHPVMEDVPVAEPVVGDG